MQPPACRHRRTREGAARFRKEAKRGLWTDSLTPVPRKNGAALSMERNGVSQDVTVQAFAPTTGEVRPAEPARSGSSMRGKQVKRKISRKQREAAREEAIRRMDEVADQASEVRQNDSLGSHFTIWGRSARRVDWWPGAQHWRGEDGMDHYGTMDEFLAAMKASA